MTMMMRMGRRTTTVGAAVSGCFLLLLLGLLSGKVPAQTVEVPTTTATETAGSNDSNDDLPMPGNIATNEWTTVDAKGYSPGNRLHHSCASNRTHLFLFGGVTAGTIRELREINFQSSDDLWVYFAGFHTWFTPKRSEPWPARRAGHSFNSVELPDGRILFALFGGTNSSQLWFYDHKTNEWTTHLDESQPYPIARHHHASAVYTDPSTNRTKVFIHGGCRFLISRNSELLNCIPGGVLSDLWAFDMETRSWIEYTARELGDGSVATDAFSSGGVLTRFAHHLFAHSAHVVPEGDTRGVPPPPASADDNGSDGSGGSASFSPDSAFLHVFGGFQKRAEFDGDAERSRSHYRSHVRTASQGSDGTDAREQHEYSFLPTITPDDAPPFDTIFNDHFSSLVPLSENITFDNILPIAVGYAQVLHGADGFVYLVGGRPSLNHAPTNKVFRFKPHLQQWGVADGSDFDENLPRRMAHCSAPIGDSAFLTVGGQAPLHFFSDIHLFDYRAELWSQLRALSHPRSVIQPAATIIEDKWFIHGGLSFVFTQAESSFFVYSFEEQSYRRVWVRNKPPPRRYGHTSTHYNGQIYLFGGASSISSARESLHNSFHVLNITAETVYQLEPRNGSAVPSPRFRHTAEYYAPTNSLYLFGGSNRTFIFADLWRYSFDTNTWEEIFLPGEIEDRPQTEIPNTGRRRRDGRRRFTRQDSVRQSPGHAPVPAITRAAATTCGHPDRADSPHHFGTGVRHPFSGDFSQGGYPREGHEDGGCYEFGSGGHRVRREESEGQDEETDVWPAPRSNHVSFIIEHRLYIQGGTGVNSVESNPFEDLWSYDILSNRWERVSSSTPLGPRFFHQASVLNGPANESKVKVLIGLGTESFTRSRAYGDMWELFFNFPADSRTTETPGEARNATAKPEIVWTELTIEVPLERAANIAGFHSQRSSLNVMGGQRGVLGERDGSEQDIEVNSIIPGCNAGFFSPDYVTTACTICPLGTFSSRPGADICTQCPGQSHTSTEGSISVDACNECAPGACGGRGTCVVNTESFQTTCHCRLGFSGQTCNVNWIGAVLGSIFSIAAIAAIIFLLVRYYRGTVRLVKLDSELHQRLLKESRIELSLLERAWEIETEDLRIHERIGEGAIGDVYRAVWHESTVAVKILKTQLTMLDESFIDEFQAEVKLQRALRHRNIVLFYGAGVFEDGNPFLVTEFMARGSLYDVLQSAWPPGTDREDPSVLERCNPDDQLPWTLRMKFALDAARGMAFLHSLSPPRLHRDIKSQNFLVSDGWVVKVADFGTTRMLKEHPSRSDSSRKSSLSLDTPMKTKQAPYVVANAAFSVNDVTLTQGVGTLCWRAPEVMDGVEYGLPSDVYSFGIMLWELDTCSVPFGDVEKLQTIPGLVRGGFRPTLPPPKDGREGQREFRRVMTLCWDGVPRVRPSFQHIVSLLQPIVSQDEQQIVSDA